LRHRVLVTVHIRLRTNRLPTHCWRLSRVSLKLRWRSPARDLLCGRCRASAKTHRQQGDRREEE
jgi:hypothetical protein